MQKDFDAWNKSKKEIEAGVSSPFCHERQIWWCALGVNVGYEQDGTGRSFDRPVVVIRSFNRHVFFGVALTGRPKQGRYYHPVGLVDEVEASAVLSQVRLIDTKRLIRRVGMLDARTFEELCSRLKDVLFP